VSATGIITTVAGTGAAGFSGDGGLATAAQLYLPAGVAVDAFGSLFIADVTGRIRKVSASGIITTVAGSTEGFSGDGGPCCGCAVEDSLRNSGRFVWQPLHRRHQQQAGSEGVG